MKAITDLVSPELRGPSTARCTPPCPNGLPWPGSRNAQADFFQLVLADEVSPSPPSLRAALSAWTWDMRLGTWDQTAAIRVRGIREPGSEGSVHLQLQWFG